MEAHMEKVKKAVIDSSLTFLLVSNLKASRKYYREALGCTKWPSFGQYGKISVWALNELKQMTQDIHPHKGIWNTYEYVKESSLYNELMSNGAIIASEPAISEFVWG
jgi:hypothetical protein